MEKRQFGRTEMQVSVLGFGGAEIGLQNIDRGTVERLLNSALDAGLNVIDTAECYDASEELIGATVGHRRDDYFLFTKCGHPNGMSGSDDWSAGSILESIERSLRRLRTERVDLVQLHSCEEAELRNGEAIAALQTARDRGYTRFIGYSGDGAAARFAVESGAFDSLQTSLNIADQEAVELTVPLAREHGLGVIAKRPIANAAWKTGAKPTDAYQHTYWDRLRELDYEFLRTLDVPTAVGLALRFTLSVPGVCTAIVGTTNPERWVANAKLLEAGPLSEDDFAAIRRRWREVAPSDWHGQT